MPGTDKLIIPLRLRHIDPFFNLYLGPGLLRALVNLQKILKTAVPINSSKRKQPADPWAVRMNPAASILV